jgi:hypothetical protein
MIEVKKPSRRQGKSVQNFKIDDRFLYEHLRDSRAEMTWRRELEFRLMQFMLIFYPILGTAIVELFRNNGISAIAFSIVALASVVLIVIATIIVTDRIDHEHETYVDLGRQVRLIWLYFGLFEKGAYLPDQAFLPEKLLDEKTSLGTGPGFRKTKTLIRVTSATLIVLLMILTGIKIFTS